MNHLSKIRAEIDAWWIAQGKEESQKIEGLDLKIAGYDSRIDAIRDRKSGLNPLKFLGNTWARATHVPALNEQKSLLEAQRDEVTLNLSVKASEDADRLLSSVAEEDPDVKADFLEAKGQLIPLIEAVEILTDAQTRTENLIAIIQRAQKEASEAQNWEVADMLGNNAGLTVLSHMETSEAKQHLGRVGDALTEYKEFMDQVGSRLSSLQLTPLRSDAIGKVAEWDLWMGVFDVDLISIFTSWKNHKQVSKAKEKLEALETNISSILTQCNVSLSETQEDYDAAVICYLDLRSEVADFAQFPRRFYDFMPRNIEQEAATRSPERVFEL